MAAEESKARDEATHAAEAGLAGQFLERLAERIGGHANVRAVFGEPIERGDLVVVPVARVRWGVGGGSGSGVSASGSDSGSGSGGGGGAAADPVGYLEIRPTGATFVPIAPPYPGPQFVLTAGLAAAFILRARARVVRG